MEPTQRSHDALQGAKWLTKGLCFIAAITEEAALMSVNSSCPLDWTYRVGANIEPDQLWRAENNENKIQIIDPYSGRGLPICFALHMPFLNPFSIFFMFLEEGYYRLSLGQWKITKLLTGSFSCEWLCVLCRQYTLHRVFKAINIHYLELFFIAI